MNAVEFMKEHGIEKARFVIGSAEVGGVVTPKILDLKKLVQSLELIEQIGGVEVAKGKVFIADFLSLIHISEPTRPAKKSGLPCS
ncbi:hypothetical protein ACN6QZ_19000, partial [Acinetobacter baumannii]